MSGVLVVGCGYVGLEFARQSRDNCKTPVFALTRTADRMAELQDAGAEPIVGHWRDANLVLPEVDTVLVTVPHREDGDLGLNSHIAGIENLLQRLPNSWKKLVYISTTGVYGNAHEVVDEETPTEPTRIGPQIAVATEHFLSEQWASRKWSDKQLVVVRLAGIYGPGRIPLVEKLRTGEPLDVPQEGWLNLTHVSDIATMLLQVIAQDMRHSLYVFSDGHPVARQEFYRHLATLFGIAEPKFVPHDPNSSRGKRAGNKRIDPRRLLDELQLQLRFPTYREGLARAVQSLG